ncbi:MFS transporter [Nocardia sp. alder85J]|uniref:MFS transporter n=1 Tax=Nocardia sp. alder85J TaxID=2862949 RepID=UPI001CD66C3F|nr:MFS transporter [Nocardia sp. alder85J]MCX4091819.1 MFS transporter [Nocardia sp. alder85J]
MFSSGTARWWALGAVSLNVLAVSLDGTVLSVALPTLARSLHATESDLEWFSAGYLLVLAAAVLPAGLIGDRFGRKGTMLISLGLFGIGSVCCACAPSPGWFLAARLLMGVAGAGITVMAMSALTVLFEEDQRARAVGIYQSANFLALPLGPILGGWLLSHFWWGLLFLLNGPIVGLGLVVGGLLIPRSRAEQRPGLDPVGTAAATIGLVALTYGLIEAGQRGWTDPVAVSAMVAGGLALTGFFRWERQLARRGGRPLIDPALFRSRAFTAAAGLGGLIGMGMVGLLFTMPQYFQAVRGTDALGSGLRMLPLVGGLVAGALPAAWCTRVLGAKYTVALGFTLNAAGAGLGATTGSGSGTVFVAAWMALMCAGTGLALSAVTALAVTTLTPERSGIGSAVVQAFQKTSAPLGTAVLGSVLAADYRARLDPAGPAPAAAEAARSGVTGGAAVAERTPVPGFAAMVQDAFVHGMDMSMLVAAAIAAAGAVAALALLPVRQPATPVRAAAHAV